MGTSSTLQKQTTSSIDYKLLMSRLEAEIIQGSDPQRCLQILEQSAIWENLPPENQLKWANLAQVAGAVETTIAVYAHLHRMHPELEAAWREHIELMILLDRRTEAAQVVAAARPHLGADQLQAYLNQTQTTAPQHPEADIISASQPFESMRTRSQAIEHYLGLFSGRPDCFARQWADRADQKQGYVPVKRPLESKDIEDHIMGRLTYGIYLLSADATVKTSVLDVDLVQKFRQPRLPSADVQLVRRERDYLVQRISEISIAAGLHPIVEFSGGKGFHFWYCFESPVSAIFARGLLERIRGGIAGDLSAFNLEVFPKQDHLSGKGYGNLVKLPLGIHRVSGKRSWFIECHDRTVESQLAFLSKVAPIAMSGIQAQPVETASSAPVVLHPRFKEWADAWPELYRLEQCCPPLAQIMASCRSKNGLSIREEQVLFQTIGFLQKKKTVLHMLLADQPEYNPHLVDFKLSRVRGAPLGCARIHSLLGFTGDMCRFQAQAGYAHPLLHLDVTQFQSQPKSEKIENLSSALENLKLSIMTVQHFLA